MIAERGLEAYQDRRCNMSYQEALGEAIHSGNDHAVELALHNLFGYEFEEQETLDALGSILNEISKKKWGLMLCSVVKKFGYHVLVRIGRRELYEALHIELKKKDLESLRSLLNASYEEDRSSVLEVLFWHYIEVHDLDRVKICLQLFEEYVKHAHRRYEALFRALQVSTLYQGSEIVKAILSSFLDLHFRLGRQQQHSLVTIVRDCEGHLKAQDMINEAETQQKMKYATLWFTKLQ